MIIRHLKFQYLFYYFIKKVRISVHYVIYSRENIIFNILRQFDRIQFNSSKGNSSPTKTYTHTHTKIILRQR